ncbi:uncharacterized protein FIESC28_04652 [Fusarium coffeatum]|uniref:Uncharacterized protein n=1 Tax=Fusarium coffeatum TaxID=231269 RepID=A0A366RYJ9_9HYPO|nr:uncharacterized protein FIESC28_04652 [Fusarium coffeatum]RBR22147.1 hypothetical protein FIESC28_04652 [Fusarium coffeatum]
MAPEDTTMGNTNSADDALATFLASEQDTSNKRSASETGPTNGPPTKKRSTKWCNANQAGGAQHIADSLITVQCLFFCDPPDVPLNNLKADVAELKGAQVVADSVAEGAQKSAITANNKIKELEKLQKPNKRVDNLSHIIEFVCKRVKQL